MGRCLSERADIVLTRSWRGSCLYLCVGSTTGEVTMKVGYRQAAWRLFQVTLSPRCRGPTRVTWADTELEGTPFQSHSPASSRRPPQEHALSGFEPPGVLPMAKSDPRPPRALRAPDAGFPLGGETHSAAAMPASSLSTAAVVLLGVIALGSLAQAAVPARPRAASCCRWGGGWTRSRRGCCATFIRSWRTSRRRTRNLAAASELTEQQARRIDGLVTTRRDQAGRARARGRGSPAAAGQPPGGWVAALRGLRTLFDFYRGLRG